jgi:hypothetical protein
MQDLHRVAAPGAQATFQLPYGSSDDAFEDPTHVRQYFLNSTMYFAQPNYWRADYGYRGDWATEHVILDVARARYETVEPAAVMDDVMRLRNVVMQMTVQMRAVKPIREPLKELMDRPQVTFNLV